MHRFFKLQINNKIKKHVLNAQVSAKNAKRGVGRNGSSFETLFVNPVRIFRLQRCWREKGFTNAEMVMRQ